MAVTILDELTEVGPSIDYEGGTAECTRRVLIAGNDFATYATELFGSAFLAGWGFTVARRPAHPRYTWMYGTGLEIAETKPSNYAPLVAGGYPERVEVHIHYKGDLLNENKDPDDPDPPSGTYLTHSKQFAAEMMTLPDAAFVWEDDNPETEKPNPLPGDIAPGMVIPTLTHTFTWRGVTYPPWDDIESATGRVNESDQIGLKEETCLFLGASEVRTFDLNGSIEYELTYTFAERKLKDGNTHITWNHFWRKADPDTGVKSGWYKIYRKDENEGRTTDKVYDDYDFTKLFIEGPS